jgi:hypothetical protein
MMRQGSRPNEPTYNTHNNWWEWQRSASTAAASSGKPQFGVKRLVSHSQKHSTLDKGAPKSDPDPRCALEWAAHVLRNTDCGPETDSSKIPQSSGYSLRILLQKTFCSSFQRLKYLPAFSGKLSATSFSIEMISMFSSATYREDASSPLS